MNYQFGLIGFPIKHSLSPWIHEQFFKRTDSLGDYSIIEIDTKHSFAEKMNELKNRKLHGFNVTVPYKEKIIPFLDELDEQAAKIGAVNTVLCKNGKWIGYNTDGAGYVRSLVSKFPHLATEKDKKILLLGAGGAAKGIYYALQFDGYKDITIANRTIEKAKEMIGEESNHVITIQQAQTALMQFDIIIQTTSVGMKPNIENSIIEISNVKENAIVSDIVYQPLKTKLLTEAEVVGADIHFGHTMLLYQAQFAFEIWTGKSPTMDNLDDELQKILEG